MDFTSRMVALLRELRRERNGAVADTMGYYGAAYGLNYGVSLPTLRKLARAEHPDHDFARYLYRQDVRELRLAALHIARPDRLCADEFLAWAAGIVNSEIAEEAAFALLSRTEALPALFREWIASPDALLQYAALLAAARSPRLTVEWAAPAVEAVHRNAVAEEAAARAADVARAADAAGTAAPSDISIASDAPAAPATPATPATSATSATSATPATPATPAASAALSHTAPAASAHTAATQAFRHPVPAARLTAQGAVALLAAVGAQNGENRLAVLRATGSLGKLPAEDYVHEELAWRLEA